VPPLFPIAGDATAAPASALVASPQVAGPTKSESPENHRPPISTAGSSSGRPCRRSGSARYGEKCCPHCRAPGPDGWRPGRELGKQTERTGKVLPDQVVHHAGQCSARLENGDPRDITVLEYSTQRAAAQGPPVILANRRYTIRWWVKGERVENADAGPILMMNVVSNDRGREYHIFSAEDAPLRGERSTGNSAN